MLLSEQEEIIYGGRGGFSADLPDELSDELSSFLEDSYQLSLPSGISFAPRNDHPLNWSISLWETFSGSQLENAKFGLGVSQGTDVSVEGFVPGLDAESKRWDSFPISERAKNILYKRFDDEGDTDNLCLIGQLKHIDQREDPASTAEIKQPGLIAWIDRWFILDRGTGVIVARSALAEKED